MMETTKEKNYFLFIASDYKPMPGGIAAYIDNLARGLIKLGNKAKILGAVYFDEKERITFLENYEEWVSPFPMLRDGKSRGWLQGKFISLLEIVGCWWPGARRILERTSFFRGSTLATLRLRDILSEDRPGMVVFGHLDRRLHSFVFALHELQVPYGIIAHDVEVYKHPIYKVNDRIIRGRMLHGARWIAANSVHTRSLVEMWGISRNKIKIVHPPISEEVIKESAGSYPTAKNSNYILVTICRLVQSKGIDVVLRALKVLDENGVPFRYIIGGDGEERSILERFAEDLKLKEKVQFLGSISDERKAHLLRMADVFVMPSRVNPKLHHEGFGMAFIEAAAFGIPGVGSDAGGIPDAVVHGETGLLVPQESPEKLAEALIYLYKNPERRKAMGKAAMERARSQFSPTAIAAHFQKEIG